MAKCGLFATLLIGCMGTYKALRINEIFESVYPTIAFDSTHFIMQFWIYEPKERRHWCSITHVRFVFNNHGATINSSYGNCEATREGAPEKFFNYFNVLR
jgi:hypothetical protein